MWRLESSSPHSIIPCWSQHNLRMLQIQLLKVRIFFSPPAFVPLLVVVFSSLLEYVSFSISSTHRWHLPTVERVCVFHWCNLLWIWSDFSKNQKAIKIERKTVFQRDWHETQHIHMSCIMILVYPGISKHVWSSLLVPYKGDKKRVVLGSNMAMKTSSNPLGLHLFSKGCR